MNASVALLSARARGAASPCPSPVLTAELERLYCALDHVTVADNPRTARLMGAGLRKISQKVVEEAAEVALEAVRKRTDTAICESADLLYHLVVLWQALAIQPADVWAEMHRRADAYGLAEKPPKRPCSAVEG